MIFPRPHLGPWDPGDRKCGDPGAEAASVASGKDVEETERGQEQGCEGDTASVRASGLVREGEVGHQGELPPYSLQ